MAGDESLGESSLLCCDAKLSMYEGGGGRMFAALTGDELPED